MGSIAGRGFDSCHLHQSFKFLSSCIYAGVIWVCGIYRLGNGLIDPDARGRLLQNLSRVDFYHNSLSVFPRSNPLFASWRCFSDLLYMPVVFFPYIRTLFVYAIWVDNFKKVYLRTKVASKHILESDSKNVLTHSAYPS